MAYTERNLTDKLTLRIQLEGRYIYFFLLLELLKITEVDLQCRVIYRSAALQPAFDVVQS